LAVAYLPCSDLPPSSPEAPPFFNIVSCAAIVFLAYQGFSLITNAADDIENPKKMVPKALFPSFPSVSTMLSNFRALVAQCSD
jgi:amino acid transporter